MGARGKGFVPGGAADHDAARVEVIVQGMALAQKFRAEQNMRIVEFFAHRRRISNRHGGFDDHSRLRRILPGQRQHGFDAGSIKIILFWVVVGGGGDHDDIRAGVGGCGIGRGVQIQRLFGQILLNFPISNGAFAGCQQGYLFGQDIYRPYLVVLGQQHTDAETHITSTGNGNFHKQVLP